MRRMLLLTLILASLASNVNALEWLAVPDTPVSITNLDFDTFKANHLIAFVSTSTESIDKNMGDRVYNLGDCATKSVIAIPLNSKVALFFPYKKDTVGAVLIDFVCVLAPPTSPKKTF